MEQLIEAIGDALAPHGFRPHWRSRMADLGVAAFWRRCTWNTNRAVAVLRRPERDLAIGPYCQRIKWKLLRHTRFVPFLYEVGLQLIVVGDGLEQASSWELRAVVDKVSNQFVVLQSVFVVDESTHQYDCARTWGQIVTGKFQNAIAGGIEAAGFKAAEPA